MTFQEAPTGRLAVSAANPNNTNDQSSSLKAFKRGRSLELSMGSPAQYLDAPAGTLTYSEADFEQTVQRFAEYGVRILAPDEVAVELPLYPKPLPTRPPSPRA
jgi:hypothetical protein